MPGLGSQFFDDWAIALDLTRIIAFDILREWEDSKRTFAARRTFRKMGRAGDALLLSLGEKGSIPDNNR